jgi:hypothetical protein
MGCDFYIYYELVIQYKHQSGEERIIRHTLEDTRERNDWWICEQDEDFEEWDDYIERRKKKRMEQLQYELEKYSKFDLYKDGNWLCTSKAKEKYMVMIETYINRQHKRVTEENLIAITKEPVYDIRCGL